MNGDTNEHVEGCEFLSFRQLAEERGENPPVDDRWYDEAGIELCAPGCPRVQYLKAEGRRLAEKHGWLKADA